MYSRRKSGGRVEDRSGRPCGSDRGYNYTTKTGLQKMRLEMTRGGPAQRMRRKSVALRPRCEWGDPRIVTRFSTAAKPKTLMNKLVNKNNGIQGCSASPADQESPDDVVDVESARTSKPVPPSR